MKTLFTSDHAAWLFLASFPVLAGGLLLGWPALTAAGILALYVSFDVLGYKWVLHRHVVHVVQSSVPKRAIPFYASAYQQQNLEVLRKIMVDRMKPNVAAYRLFQHGLMLPVLALAWICAGPAAVAAPVIVWLTYGADALYHPVARAPFAPWDNETYYNHGYWTVVGWFYWIDAKSGGTDPAIMPAYAMYLQAIAGAIAAVGVLI